MGEPGVPHAAWLYSAADGRPQEKHIQVAPGQAARHASARGAAGQHVPAVRAAQAAAPDVPELQDLRRPRDRAAAHADSLEALTMTYTVSTGRFRRTRRQSQRVLMTASQATP